MVQEHCLIIIIDALCSQISEHLWFSSTLWWAGWYTFWKASVYLWFSTQTVLGIIICLCLDGSDFGITGGWVECFRWLLFTLDVFVSFCSNVSFILFTLYIALMVFLNPLFGSCKEMRERKLKLFHEVKNETTSGSVSRTSNLESLYVPLDWKKKTISCSSFPVLLCLYRGLVNVFQLQKGIRVSGLKFFCCYIISHSFYLSVMQSCPCLKTVLPFHFSLFQQN